MTDQTKIEWTDYTVNFWEGCQKVGPGCDHCYAEARDNRFTGGAHWGPGAPRRKVKGGVAKLQKINRDSAKFQAEHGRKPRVFFSSLCDLFDNAVDPMWTAEALFQIETAEDIHAQMLTKRIGNVEKMVPDGWMHGCWPQHAGLMITVVNQVEANRDIPKLLDLKAKAGIPWVGLSVEPMLDPVDVSKWLHDSDCVHDGVWLCSCRYSGGPFEAIVDWIIAGGESGPGARPMHPDWVRSLRDQCQAAGTPFLFKQWGEWAPADLTSEAQEGEELAGRWNGVSHRVGKNKAGRLLDGQDWTQFPSSLAIDTLFKGVE